MSNRFLKRTLWLSGILAFGGVGACFTGNGSVPGPSDAGHPSNGAGDGNAGSSNGDSGSTRGPEAGASKDAGSILTGNWTYVLVDDMETTTHGPLELDAGIAPPLTPGYWYNSGAQVGLDAGVADAGDISNPPQQAFTFTPLASPNTTLHGTVSHHAARQFCVLTGLYDTCGVGFEFAQQPLADAGISDATSADARSPDAAASDASVVDASAVDGGDGGPPTPRETIPFDITQYRGITFWGMTTTPDSTGSLTVKLQFPDTDTDPRGSVCNGGSLNTTECYNSYAALLGFTTTWQQYVVWLDPGDGGGAPDGGIALDPTWGYQGAQWIPNRAYGANWQAQKNTDPDAGPVSTDIWVDDVYFIK
jgi:hypothetical protein